MSKISVVVPVYNDKDYLIDCVESILAQKHCDIEIILVDDGSNDGSERLCDHLSDEYDNVKTFHQSNKGQNSARSRGVREASGEYIGFVDADDWIEPDMFSALLMGMGKADLVTSGIFVHGADGTICEIWHDNLTSGIYSVRDDAFKENIFMSQNYDGVSGMPGALLNNLVCKLYRKKILIEILNEAETRITYREDFLFLMLYLLKCEVVVITDNSFYHYRFNRGSVTHSINPSFFQDRANEYAVIRNAIKKSNFGDGVINGFNRRFLFDFVPLMYDQLDIPSFLSFPIYSFQDNDLIARKRIVLFGAGRVGASYYCLWELNSLVERIIWVDNSKSGEKILGCNIERPDIMKTSDFDYVVLAAFDEKVATSMRNQVCSYGVSEKCILWKKPIDTWRKFYGEDLWTLL